MKFSIILPALALFTSALAAPTYDNGVNVSKNGASINALTFGAGFSMDTCELSMKAWMQAKGLCEKDGSIGGTAQGYLNGVLAGKTGFEGLFGMNAGFSLGDKGGLAMNGGLSMNGIFLKGACQGLLNNGLNMGAGISVDQCGTAMKGWLQAKGVCEADGSIGDKAKSYINGVLVSGKTGFEGLLGMTGGFKFAGGKCIGGDLKGIAEGTIKGAMEGLLSSGAKVGGQVVSTVGQAAAGGAGGLGGFVGIVGGLIGGQGQCSCDKGNNGGY